MKKKGGKHDKPVVMMCWQCKDYVVPIADRQGGKIIYRCPKCKTAIKRN